MVASSRTPRRPTLAALACTVCLLVARAEAGPSPHFTLQDAFAFPNVESMIAARSGDHIAWIVEDRGVRNVYGAESPDWKVAPLTHFSADNGSRISDLEFSADGTRLTFVLGGEHENEAADGYRPDPLSDPVARRPQVWCIDWGGGDPYEVTDGDAAMLSPRGDRLAVLRGPKALLVALPRPSASGPQRPAAEEPIYGHGAISSLAWSPDGSALALVSARNSHGLLGIFRSPAEPIEWIAPSADQIESPRWSPDGRSIAFVKVPGAGGRPHPLLAREVVPFAIWVADATTGEAHAIYRSPAGVTGSLPDTMGGLNLAWGAGNRLIFTAHLDGWTHAYSLSTTSGTPQLLTPGAFMVEQLTVSPDRGYVVYSANAGADPNDIDRRHLFSVPVDGGRPPEPLTRGTNIEWGPTITGDGRTVAFFSAGTRRPSLPAILTRGDGIPRLLKMSVPAQFAGASFVDPRPVLITAADGTRVHGQLFDSSAAAGSTKPGLIFVHGGPNRQMLLGFHPMSYYSRDYAMNQYLANRGFVVLSINYRQSIGYGDAFMHPANAGWAGASEYADVLAAADYLAKMPQVDAHRIGIYGGSYGGYLTGLALARNSDIFAAGVALHGVYNWLAFGREQGGFYASRGNTYEDPPDLREAIDIGWKSSPVADVERWRSPILLIHGDDDRNANVAQTIDLVQRLRQHGVPYEDLIIPDEVHDWLLFRTWQKVAAAEADFLERTLGSKRR